MLQRQPLVTPVTRAQRAWRDVRRFARRYQRWVGAALIGVAALLALSVLAPAPAPTVPLTVAARDLPAGSRLVGDDLRDVSAPAQLVPDAALDRTAAVGQVLLAPVAAGETITSARLSGSGLLVGTAPDTVALPVRLADPAAAALLVPGDRVDLLATSASDAGSDGVRVVGRDLVVLHSPGVHSDEREVMATDDLLGGLVVVAATERESFAIIEGAAGGPLWASLRQAG